MDNVIEFKPRAKEQPFVPIEDLHLEYLEIQRVVIKDLKAKISRERKESKWCMIIMGFIIIAMMICLG